MANGNWCFGWERRSGRARGGGRLLRLTRRLGGGTGVEAIWRALRANKSVGRRRREEEHRCALRDRRQNATKHQRQERHPSHMVAEPTRKPPCAELCGECRESVCSIRCCAGCWSRMIAYLNFLTIDKHPGQNLEPNDDDAYVLCTNLEPVYMCARICQGVCVCDSQSERLIHPNRASSLIQPKWRYWNLDLRRFS